MAKRREWTGETLAAGVREGDRRALARAITLVENGDPLAYDLVREVYPDTGSAYVVGITGPPGVGKSSLIAALVRRIREAGRTVGVISVDPSSPFTKGALLGDRIRLSEHFLDPGVFIRSMGTRGHLGGLAEATLQALLVLDAAGKDIVFVETVGTGQSEVEVIGIADTVLLVLMPGSGDSIQALKAGIMEIPDVIAINKKDHPAAKTMLNEVRSILTLDKERAWKPPIVLTEAISDEGVADLWAKVEAHRAHLDEEGLLDERRRRNLAGEVFAVASARAKAHLERAVEGDPELRRLLDEVQRRELDPLTAVREIMDKVFKLGDGDSPTLADVEAARERLAGKGVRVTPLYSSETFTRHDRPARAPEGGERSSGRAPSRSAAPSTRSRRLDRGGAEGRRRRGERGEPRPGGRLGGSRGRDRGDRSSCRPRRRWRRSRRRATTAPRVELAGVRSRMRSRRALAAASRKPARPSSTPSRTRS